MHELIMALIALSSQNDGFTKIETEVAKDDTVTIKLYMFYEDAWYLHTTYVEKVK